MNDFMSFRKMITPLIIQIIFWIGVAVCVIGGIVALANGSAVGLLMLVVGPLVVRIYCELLIVIFRINDTLTGIWYNTQRPGP